LPFAAGWADQLDAPRLWRGERHPIQRDEAHCLSWPRVRPRLRAVRPTTR
jgi:hypothetical protein